MFLDEVARRHADENVIMGVDGAGEHKSQAIELPENLKRHFLPPLIAQLNSQETIGEALREKYFHNKAFESMPALEDDPQQIKSIAGWEWITQIET